MIIRGDDDNVKIIRTDSYNGNGILFNITGANVLIKNLYIENYDTAILASNTNSITIQELNITSNSLNGITVYFNNVGNSNIKQNTIHTIGSGIILYSSSLNNISENHITSSGIKTYGIRLNSYSINNNIVGNHVNGTGINGSAIYLNQYSNYNNISFNYLNTTSYQNCGVFLEMYNSYNNIVGNQINTLDTYSVGIYLINGNNNNNITRNHIITSGDSAWGVLIYFYSINNNISENYISTNGKNAYGIFSTLFSSSNNITSNNILTEADGIYISGSHTNMIISYNRILSNSSPINFTSTTTGNVVEANWFGTNNLSEINLNLNGIEMPNYYIVSAEPIKSDGSVGENWSIAYKFILNDSSYGDYEKLPNFIAKIFDSNDDELSDHFAKISATWNIPITKVVTNEPFKMVLDNQVIYLGNFSSTKEKTTPNTEITITANPKIGEEVLVTIRYSEKGNPIVNHKVKVYLDGVFISDETTNSNGEVSFKRVFNKSDNHDVKFVFTENDSWNEIINNKEFSIKPLDSRLTITPVNGSKGDVVQIIAKLTDGSGKPLSGKIITFTINGADYTNITNSNGIAILNYHIALAAGIYSVNAKFEGDSYYNEIQAISVNMVVSPKNVAVGHNPENNNNKKNSNNNINKYPNVYGNMEKTGIPIIAIILVLLSSLGLIVKRK